MRVDMLSDEQEARLPEWVAEWIAERKAIAHSAEPANWAAFTDGARRCYEYTHIPWHGRVVRVSSPVVLALAAPIAAAILDCRASRDGRLHSVMDDAVPGLVRQGVSRHVHYDVLASVRASVTAAVKDVAFDEVHQLVENAVGRVANALDDDADVDADDDLYDDDLYDEEDEDGSVGFDGVDDAMSAAVDDAVSAAVGYPVRGAVGYGVHFDRIGSYLGWSWYDHKFDGQWGVFDDDGPTFFRDVCGLENSGVLWDRGRAFAKAQSSAGWWWPHVEFVMVCDRPEIFQPARDRSGRPHREDGPLVRWRDGRDMYYWHGVRVPADLIEGGGWTAERILRERNQEFRRCAVERIGWERFIAEGNLAQVGETVPDPGNPGGDLALYDVPYSLFAEPVRVLLCLNGTTERDGTRRRYGLTVPRHFADPVAAAAWTYDWPVETYRRLARRT